MEDCWSVLSSSWIRSGQGWREDRASVHTANRIERFFERSDRMNEIRLPTACPELNPCEGVWDWSKLNDMGNVTPKASRS
ncbi:transposase [Halapricum desulfuricans]|uniref:transposase n=1 Tax=Halapricum desulfuricans TaxID=2841257 RepID=UPI0037444838